MFDSYSYFLFDFDGTLVDSMPSYERVMKKILTDHGISFREDLIETITPLGTQKTAEYFCSLGLSMTPDEIYGEMKRCLCDEYFYRIPAKAGVADTLSLLKKKKKSLYVLTASPHITLDACMERLGLAQYFDAIWSSDDFGFSKNDVQIYDRVAEAIGCKKEEILFFDDNLTACRTAKKAGLDVCAVFDAASAQTWEDLNKTADYVLMNFAGQNKKK